MLVGWRRKNGLLKTGDKASSEEKPVQLHNTYMYIGSVKQLHTCTVILLIH